MKWLVVGWDRRKRQTASVPRSLQRERHPQPTPYTSFKGDALVAIPRKEPQRRYEPSFFFWFFFPKKREQLIKLKQKLSANREKESLPLGAKGPSFSAPSSLISKKTLAHPPSKREVHRNYREFSEGGGRDCWQLCDRDRVHGR